MFNGIIYNTGKIQSIKKTKKSILIGISSNINFKKKEKQFFESYFVWRASINKRNSQEIWKKIGP